MAQSDDKEEKLVRYTMDPNNPPPLSEADRARLAALGNIPDDQIDYSDQPELTDEQLAQMVRRPDLFKPRKESTTIRLDADVLAWLKKQGRGYQTRINSILRAAMLQDLRASE